MSSKLSDVEVLTHLVGEFLHQKKEANLSLLIR